MIQKKLFNPKRSMLISCGQGYSSGEYRIKKVVNSTDYNPGSTIPKKTVERLIEQGWTITIVKG